MLAAARRRRDHGKSLILCTHLLGDVERVCEQVVLLDLEQLASPARWTSSASVT